MATATALSKPAEAKPLTIRDHLKSDAMLAEIRKAMPKHCSAERMARVAMTAITKTPKLAECDQASFFQALLSLSQWGLEPDGRRAHLIPFENRKRGVVEVQLIIDYKGLVELAYRSGVVKNIHADVVREGDLFDYNLGRVVRHTPWFLRRDADKPEKPGDVICTYCMVELSGETVKCEVLSKDEVEGVRRRSKAGSNGPWVTDWNEMAKKTAFRRASKWLPLSAEIVEAFERDDDTLIDSHVVSDAKPVNSLADLTRQLQQKQAEVSREREPGEDDEPLTPGEITPEQEAEFAEAAAADAAENGLFK